MGGQFLSSWARKVQSSPPTPLSIHFVTYLLTPWGRILLEKLTVLQLVKKFPAFHGTPKFITALTSVRYLSLSWASPIQSIYPHLTSWRSILILSTHLRLGLPSGLFPSGFPHQDPIHPLSSPIRATCPAHLILLDFITRTILGEEYRSSSSSLCNLLLTQHTNSFYYHLQLGLSSDLFPSDLLTKTFPEIATSPAHTNSHVLFTLIVRGELFILWACQYAATSIFLLLLPSSVHRYVPRHHVLEHPQPTLLP
jgi:hypothetical protein